MRKTSLALVAVLLAWTGAAEPVCVNGVCYPDEESARAAGALGGTSGKNFADLQNMLQAADKPEGEKSAGEKPAAEKTPPDRLSRRLALGYMTPVEFRGFLHGKKSPGESLEELPLAMVFLFVLLGGLVMNLTPCVLPLVPVSLVLVGRGGARGAAYGLGMTLAYGALGLAAAFGGLAFGAIQSSPWFNLVVAVVFLVLGLATSEVFFIDFSRFRPRPKAGVPADAKSGLGGPFLLGAGTAVLAGACVAPILLATLVLTAKWFAEGRVWAVALPFVLGAGMGLPWPFITAGMAVLPKPGAWMRWVNRAFAVVLFGFAVWYGWLAWGAVGEPRLRRRPVRIRRLVRLARVGRVHGARRGRARAGAGECRGRRRLASDACDRGRAVVQELHGDGADDAEGAVRRRGAHEVQRQAHRDQHVRGSRELSRTGRPRHQGRAGLRGD